MGYLVRLVYRRVGVKHVGLVARKQLDSPVLDRLGVGKRPSCTPPSGSPLRGTAGGTGVGWHPCRRTSRTGGQKGTGLIRGSVCSFDFGSFSRLLQWASVPRPAPARSNLRVPLEKDHKGGPDTQVDFARQVGQNWSVSAPPVPVSPEDPAHWSVGRGSKRVSAGVVTLSTLAPHAVEGPQVLIGPP